MNKIITDLPSSDWLDSETPESLRDFFQSRRAWLRVVAFSTAGRGWRVAIEVDGFWSFEQDAIEDAAYFKERLAAVLANEGIELRSDANWHRP